jgi:hypothetical protein
LEGEKMTKRRRFLAVVGIVLISLFGAGLTGNVLAGQVTLAWDANTEPDLAGYNLYYGLEPGIYGPPNKINVGNVTTYTITGLTNGVRYNFVATAYDTLGNESGYSNEVLYTPPLLNFTITATAGAGGNISCSNGGSPIGQGTDVTCTMTAYAGKRLDSLLVDGSPQAAVSPFIFSNVTANHTIRANFADIDPNNAVVFSNGILFVDNNHNGIYDGPSVDTFRSDIRWIFSASDFLN